MKFPFVLCFLFFPFWSFAQKADTIYFDSDKRVLSVLSPSGQREYYRVILQVNDSLLRVKDCFMNDRVYRMGYVQLCLPDKIGDSDLEEMLNWDYKREGVFIEYSKDGVPRHFRMYKNGMLEGYEKMYFENGKLFKAIEHRQGESKSEKELIVYHPDGSMLVSNGNGFSEEWNGQGQLEKGMYKQGVRIGEWQGFYKNEKPWYIEEYDEEGLVQGLSYDSSGKEYSYEALIVPSSFKGGRGEMGRILESNLRYTQDAQNQKIEGMVLVKFKVDEKGEMVEINLLKRVHPHLDAIALKAVVSLQGKWIPGRRRGQPAGFYFTIPIHFEL